MAKNLNDVIHGDRAMIRGGQVKQSTYGSWKDDIDWGDQKVLPFEPTSSKGHTVKQSHGGYESCYKSHKPMKLPGTDLVIHGGSCGTPAVLDAEVYVGFDSGMRFTQRHWPWKKGHEVLFRISDMQAPDDPVQFKKLVTWVKSQLDEGKKVHCGCIGGHGRTGTFLAALVSEYGEPDAITYVREHYCKKAVESDSQVKFLHEHFGVVKAKGHKSGGSSGSSSGKSGSKGGLDTFDPISGNGCIWEAAR